MTSRSRWSTSGTLAWETGLWRMATATEAVSSTIWTFSPWACATVSDPSGWPSPLPARRRSRGEGGPDLLSRFQPPPASGDFCLICRCVVLTLRSGPPGDLDRHDADRGAGERIIPDRTELDSHSFQVLLG